MKIVYNILFLFFGLTSITNGQNNFFQWQDTTFEIGSKRIIKLWFDYDGPCTVKPCYNYMNNSLTIDTIINFLIKNPNLIIEIGCHMDTRGKANYNLRKSEKWAEGTKNLLIELGISEDRLTCKGYGETMPLIDKRLIKKIKSEEEKVEAHRKNERFELTILEY